MFGWGFECTARCCLCHNVFLITIPEVRCQQAASNPICITCSPSSVLNSWEGCRHQSLLTSCTVKHFIQQLWGPHRHLQQGQAGLYFSRIRYTCFPQKVFSIPQNIKGTILGIHFHKLFHKARIMPCSGIFTILTHRRHEVFLVR